MQRLRRSIRNESTRSNMNHTAKISESANLPHQGESISLVLTFGPGKVSPLRGCNFFSTLRVYVPLLWKACCTCYRLLIADPGYFRHMLTSFLHFHSTYTKSFVRIHSPPFLKRPKLSSFYRRWQSPGSLVMAFFLPSVDLLIKPMRSTLLFPIWQTPLFSLCQAPFFSTSDFLRQFSCGLLPKWSFACSLSEVHTRISKIDRHHYSFCVRHLFLPVIF
jgi:hypothetical protein